MVWKANRRCDVLQIGFDLLFVWDIMTILGAGVGCDLGYGQLVGAGEDLGGLHPEALRMTGLGALLAPLMLRDRWTRSAPGAFASNGLLARSLQKVVVLGAVLLAIGFLTHDLGKLPRLWMTAWLASMVATTIGGRLIYIRAAAAMARRGLVWDRVAVVGSGPNADWLRRRISEAGCPGVQLLAIRAAVSDGQASLDELVETLVERGRHGELDRVVLAFPEAADHLAFRIAHRLKVLEIEVTSFYPLTGCGGRVETTQVAGVPQFVVNGRARQCWGGVAKGIEDRVLAALLVLWIAPLLLVIALAIRLDSPGPVIFRQRRHGQNGLEFEVFKFRTMYWHGAGAGSGAVQTRRKDSRITAVGALLRKTSLDELPQLFNVLNGTMSLVGPRPHPTVMRTEERLGDEIIAEYAHRHRVKPGITGWAQINGYRGATETAEQLRRRVEHDMYYIDNWSLLLDLRILALTPIKVLFQRSNAF